MHPFSRPKLILPAAGLQLNRPIPVLSGYCLSRSHSQLRLVWTAAGRRGERPGETARLSAPEELVAQSQRRPIASGATLSRSSAGQGQEPTDGGRTPHATAAAAAEPQRSESGNHIAVWWHGPKPRRWRMAIPDGAEVFIVMRVRLW